MYMYQLKCRQRCLIIFSANRIISSQVRPGGLALTSSTLYKSARGINYAVILHSFPFLCVHKFRMASYLEEYRYIVLNHFCMM